MASAIDTVYATLDTTEINVAGYIPRVYTLDELKMWTDTADLPLRLLLPVNGRNQATSFEFDVFGHSQAQVVWRVTDLMLYRNINEGTGLKDYAAELLEYEKEYLEMLLTQVMATGAPLWVSGATSSIDAFEWPEESNQFYWGVEIVLAITEQI